MAACHARRQGCARSRSRARTKDAHAAIHPVSASLFQRRLSPNPGQAAALCTNRCSAQSHQRHQRPYRGYGPADARARGMRSDDVALHARKLRAWRERRKSLTRPKASALWSNKNFAEWGTATINIGVAPQSGGGFKVRLLDFASVAARGPTLVVRSPASTPTFSPVSEADRFCVRMNHGSTADTTHSLQSRC